MFINEHSTYMFMIANVFDNVLVFADVQYWPARLQVV